MSVAKQIAKIRSSANMSQEQFGRLLDVSRQAVQKWESGESAPELEKIIRIAKYFGLTVDAIVLDGDKRTTETLSCSKKLIPDYENMFIWESYASDLLTEYQQSVDEGLDVEKYEDLFTAVAHLPLGEIKEKLSDVLYDIVHNAPIKEDYKYVEPSELEQIKALREPYSYNKNAVPNDAELEKKIYGAWYGRACGCMLGQTVETIHTDELIPFLKESGNYPLHRYITRADATEEVCNKYTFRFAPRNYADEMDGMPIDDDMNYVLMAQVIVDTYGRNFTSVDVSKSWLALQPKDEYCTAERVAFRNFINGYEPPKSAIYKNPYREWIGAQIRGDYFGYINPGDTEGAADMAFRDACISHTKNGIYGEMFAAAMLAAAAVTDNVQDVIKAALAEVPYSSRLYESVYGIINAYNSGVSKEECFNRIHSEYDEYTNYGWCHTIANAMVVTACLLYGEKDFAKSICMAVETGFDTDCNGATVGSVLGMILGVDAIDDVWKKPIGGECRTSIKGYPKINLADRVKIAMKHIAAKESK